MISSFCKIFIFLFVSVLIEADDKTPCQGCRDLVDGLLKGLDKTAGKNFGGGDVDWEEKRNLKYKSSELRLVEILEHACAKDNYQCNKLLEEHEEDIETWYRKNQNDQSISLHEFLCINTAKVCCPDNTFGENCEECPKGSSDQICFGRGTCEGAGDKKGSGKCVCEAGYSGEFCNDCADRYFKSFSNDTYSLCTLCHETCQTCKGPNATDCESCRPGYREDNEEEGVLKCVDVNECIEQRDLCQVGQYCVNTEGSYKCEEWTCHPMCERCYGPTHANCFSCKQGAIMRHPFICQGCSETCTACFGPSPRHCFSCRKGAIMQIPYFCQDIDECASGAICLGMYEVCVNTPGHYKCECARFFRRDPVSGQCQPDPAIYSQYAPQKPVKKEEKKEEEVKKEENKDEEKKKEGQEEENKSEEKKAEDEEQKEEL